MNIRPSIAIIAGGLLSATAAIAAAQLTSGAFADRLDQDAAEAITAAGGKGVRASFTTYRNWPTRHPQLSGGEELDEGTRANVAKAVAAVIGTGGTNWADGTMIAEAGSIGPLTPMHCQEDVQALLRSRTIRFEESSSSMQAPTFGLLDEVAAALRPCIGSIIMITGHTDNSGPEPGNLTLSRERAQAVEDILVRRGIPRDGMRVRGVGSKVPVEGLDPADPANRRIEFSVIATQPLKPTPIDTPAAR